MIYRCFRRRRTGWTGIFAAKNRKFPNCRWLRRAGSSGRWFGDFCEIPSGQVWTYGGIAAMIAARTGKKTMSAQAVGGAVGHNPISIIIPCHRVVGSNGSLTGYAGGLENKIKLLELEGVDMSGLFRPQKGTAL